MSLEPPPAPNTDNDNAARDVSFRGYLDELSSRPIRNSRFDRARTRILGTAERLTTWGPLGPIAETGWRVWRRDQQIAGSVLAAALAYRVFIWLLPLALVLVAGFGFAGKSGTSHVLSDLGITGYVSQSVSDAARGGSWFGRVVVIVAGSLVFLYETYVLLRTLRAISAFAWNMRVRPMRRPPRQVLFFLGLSVLLLVVLSLTNRIVGALSFPLGLIAGIASLVVIPAYVVLVSVVLLPNCAASWTAFIPGALLVYGTYAIVHLLATLVVVPWVAHKQATYGVLGISAGLLFLMFVFGRVIELACSLNAILEEQRQAAIAQPAEQHHRP